MEKILVTGWSGFIGKALIERLQSDFPECEIWNYGRTAVPGTIFLPMDETPFVDLPEFDWIIHALALSSDTYCRDFVFADKMNVTMTKDFISLAESTPGCAFLFFSSVVLYDNALVPPVKETDQLAYFYNTYSFTKGVAEEYVRYRMSTGNLHGAVIRLANVYGPGQKSTPDTPFLIPEKIIQAITEKRVEVRNANTKRDWLFIDDAIDGILSILRTRVSGVFNLWSGECYSAWEIATHIASKMEVEYASLDLPASGPQFFYADRAKITESTGWVPKVTIHDGLDRTIEHIVRIYSV